jgi:hypothetical protein
MNLKPIDLTKGYDYNALVLASPDGSKAYDPRYGQTELWNTGLQGRLGAKFNHLTWHHVAGPTDSVSALPVLNSFRPDAFTHGRPANYSSPRTLPTRRWP